MKFFRFFALIIIALCPLYILRSSIVLPIINFYLPFTFLEVWLVIFLVSFIIFFIQTKQKISDLKTDFDFSIFLLLLSAIVSISFSYNFWGGLGILKAYFIEPVCFYYVINFLTKKSDNKFLIRGFFAAGIWVSLFAVIQKLTGQFSLVPVELGQGRVTALYNSANSLALFLNPILLLSVVKFFQSEKKHKLYYFFLMLTFISVVVLTKSRGGMVALVLSLMIFTYIILTIKIQTLKKFWFAVPILIISGLIFFLYQVYTSYNFFPVEWGKPYTEGDTLQIRYFLWAGTINLLKDHPITGAGLNGFKTLYSNQYRLPVYQEQFQYPHNLFLTFWCETGLYGLFSFLLLLVSSLGIVIRKLSQPKNVFLGAGLIAIVAYWILHGVVDVPYFKNDLSLQFWAILALISTL